MTIEDIMDLYDEEDGPFTSSEIRAKLYPKIYPKEYKAITSSINRALKKLAKMNLIYTKGYSMKPPHAPLWYKVN